MIDPDNEFCDMCGYVRGYHRLVDDACPIFSSLPGLNSFSPTVRFAPSNAYLEEAK